MSEFRHVPLLQFIACAPVEKIPSPILRFISPSSQNDDGTARTAPYGLRKLEASLLRTYSRGEVVVAHPAYVDRFIGDETSIVGVSTMDPLGLGPLSMMFTWGGLFTAYSKKKFYDLVRKINLAREGRSCRLVVGGQGAWQLELRAEEAKRLNIDHLIIGEVDRDAGEIFQRIEASDAPSIVKISRAPKVDEIPSMVGPSVHGIVEVMRGCGRNCEFCDVNLRVARCIPQQRILEEIEVNVKAGVSNIWTHADDIFMYMLDDHRSFTPNRDALLDLFKAIVSVDGVRHSNPTHGSLAPIVADPELIRGLSEILDAGPDNYIGIQTGVETGSPTLMSRYMPLKAKPFRPEDWCEVVVEGTKILNENYWFPAYTLIIGLPGETKDDMWDTVRLIDRLERELPERVGEKAHFTITPLSFTPLGVLKHEEFFDIGRTINEARFAVIYRSWRHTLLEVNRLSPGVWRDRSLHSIPLKLLVKFGAAYLLRYIEAWGKSMGYSLEKAMAVSR